MNVTKHGFHNDGLKPLRFLSCWLPKNNKGKDHGLSKNVSTYF